MSNPFINKLKSIIMKDTGRMNESPKLIGIIRCLLIFLILNNIINGIIYINIVSNVLFYHFIASLLAFILLLYLSYKGHSHSIILATNLLTLIWIYMCTTRLGWSTGIQNYIIILLILCYFSGNKHKMFKQIYTILLVVFRLHLYFYCTKNTLILSNLKSNNLLQITNTIIIFSMIAIVMYIFSSDSQALEMKLIDYNNQLIAQANTDALTKLNNRRKGREYMEHLLAHPSDNGFSVCICDIDFFKKVNDNYGHDVGDLVLLSLASTLKNETAQNGFVARWGGEEFLIVYPNCNGDEAKIRLEALRKKIKDIRIKVGEKEISITVTFGLAEYDFNGDIDSIVKEADSKLYIGKEAGRDRIVF